MIKKLIYKNIICILLILFLLSSCQGIKIKDSKVSSATEFTLGQSMILVAEEKNKYESRFGSQIWNLKSGSGDLNFKDYIVSNVKKFVEKIMTIKLMSKSLGINLTSKDKENLELATNDYINSMNNDDLSFINCSYDDVYNLYNDYRIVNQAISLMTKNSDIELSISEAKVIQVEYMVFDDKDKAEEVRKLVQVKNARFSYYASAYSKDSNYSLIIKRGDEMSTLFPEVFYLSNGDISEVLESDGQYYVFKCIKDYLEKETNERKNEILRGIKNREFNEQYGVFEEDNYVKSNSSYWNSIDLAKGNNCKIRCFYDIYNKYFTE